MSILQSKLARKPAGKPADLDALEKAVEGAINVLRKRKQEWHTWCGKWSEVAARRGERIASRENRPSFATARLPVLTLEDQHDRVTSNLHDEGRTIRDALREAERELADARAAYGAAYASQLQPTFNDVCQNLASVEEQRKVLSRQKASLQAEASAAGAALIDPTYRAPTFPKSSMPSRHWKNPETGTTELIKRTRIVRDDMAGIHARQIDRYQGPEGDQVVVPEFEDVVEEPAPKRR